jgi:hypothetical protein
MVTCEKGAQLIPIPDNDLDNLNYGWPPTTVRAGVALPVELKERRRGKAVLAEVGNDLFLPVPALRAAGQRAGLAFEAC